MGSILTTLIYQFHEVQSTNVLTCNQNIIIKGRPVKVDRQFFMKSLKFDDVGKSMMNISLIKDSFRNHTNFDNRETPPFPCVSCVICCTCISC